MNKLFSAICVGIMTSVLAFAQTDYKKSEYYIGYSNNQVDTGADSGNSVSSFFNDRENFHGFEGSGVVNISRYVGIKGDISGTYKNQNINSSATVGTTTGTVNFDARRSLYNFLGGVQIKDNSTEGRIKPFAHALVGAGHARFDTRNASCTTISTTVCSNFNTNNSDTGLAGAFGGGLDIKLSDRINIRAIQVDYNPIRYNDSFTQHNVRLGVGIVF